MNNKLTLLSADDVDEYTLSDNRHVVTDVERLETTKTIMRDTGAWFAGMLFGLWSIVYGFLPGPAVFIGRIS